MFSISAAELMGNWAGTLFYGIYLSTCIPAARTLLFTGRGIHEHRLRVNEIRWIMIFFGLAFFVLSTFAIILGTYCNYAAFILSQGKGSASLHVYLKYGFWITIAAVISVILGDLLLIYRCWIVYGKRWSIVTPSIILFLASLATGIRFSDLVNKPSTHEGQSLQISEGTRWAIAFYAVTTLQNVLSTSILIARIWVVDHRKAKFFTEASAERHQPSQLHRVMTLIAESGAFYTLTLIISLVLVANQSGGIAPMADITLQTTGIVFNVILRRCSTSRDNQFTTYNSEKTTYLDGVMGRGIKVNKTESKDVDSGSTTHISNSSHAEVLYDLGIHTKSNGILAPEI